MDQLISLAAQWVVQWPTWEIVRALGFSSYLLLFIGVATGILQSMKQYAGKARGLLYVAHTFSLRTGLLLTVAHGLLLVVDTFQPFTWPEILIPFASEYKPAAIGSGILALYLLLFLTFNSEFSSWLGTKIWHLLHLLAYPAFLFAMVHGIAAGTDSSQTWAVTFYSATGGIILFLTILRTLAQRTGGKADAHSPGRR